MRALLFTTGSPFARAIRIILAELALDYERREEITTPSAEQRATATPTLQVPTYWDGDQVLWESGTIAEFLMHSYDSRPTGAPALAPHMFRADFEWQDKLVFATIQTFGTAATTISQLTWSGVTVAQNPHLARSAEKLAHILTWLEAELQVSGDGFMPGFLSVQDIFLLAHVRFVQARPLGVDLGLQAFPKISALLARLDERASVRNTPIYWWEPGVIGYEPGGTPIYS